MDPMMSEKDSQAPMWSYRINLDKRVRSDHPLRRINAAVELSFVREQVAHTCGMRGNKSVQPEVILRKMLLLFLDDIKSERELMRIIPERLDYLWFLGYGLDDEIPDHSVLSKARKRWGKEVFVSLFSRVVAATFNTSRNDVVSYRCGIADVAIWDQSNDGVQKSVSPAGN
jgi:transposase